MASVSLLSENVFIVQDERNQGDRYEHQNSSQIHVEVVPVKKSQAAHVQQVGDGINNDKFQYQRIVAALEDQFADSLEVEQHSKYRRKQGCNCVMEMYGEQQSVY